MADILDKYEGYITIATRIKQLEELHDVNRPSFYGASWRESLDICNTLHSQLIAKESQLNEAVELLEQSSRMLIAAGVFIKDEQALEHVNLHVELINRKLNRIGGK